MEHAVEVEGFEGRRLAIRQHGFFSGPKLVLDGLEVKRRWGKYTLRDNSGREVEAHFTFNPFDPAPGLAVDGKKIQVVSPLKWYEYAWSAAPLLLVFAGGALGAILGYFVCRWNGGVFRSERSTIAKYLLTALFSLGAFAVFLAAAVAIDLAFGS